MNAADHAALSAETRTAAPTLASMVDYVSYMRACRTHRYAFLDKLPADLRDYPDHAFGVAPRATDKKRGRAAALRELAAITAEALAELQAAYTG